MVRKLLKTMGIVTKVPMMIHRLLIILINQLVLPILPSPINNGEAEIVWWKTGSKPSTGGGNASSPSTGTGSNGVGSTNTPGATALALIGE